MLDLLAALNNSKIVWGVTMLFLNMGAKYVMADLGKVHERVLANEIAKKIIVFSMFFVATRDIITAFVLMVFYVLIVDGVMHESRNFTMVESSSVDVGYDDYVKAKNVVANYETPRAQGNQVSQSADAYEQYINHLYKVRNNT